MTYDKTKHVICLCRVAEGGTLGDSCISKAYGGTSKETSLIVDSSDPVWGEWQILYNIVYVLKVYLYNKVLIS